MKRRKKRRRQINRNKKTKKQRKQEIAPVALQTLPQIPPSAKNELSCDVFNLSIINNFISYQFFVRKSLIITEHFVPL